MSQFLSRALKLHERGYTVLPVKPNLKRVVIEGWPSLKTSVEDIHEWASSGYKNGNIGINTRNTPAVDIDVYDPVVAQKMEDWLLKKYPNACVRVGRAPKRLVLFRTDEPFRKMAVTYTDGKTDHKLEILGAGQQFVAYGIHPDTKAPYTWTTLDDPLTTDAADLPLLTHEKALKVLEYFCKVCDEAGWELLSKNSSSSLASGDGGLESFRPVLKISHETIRETLDIIANPGRDFDLWLEIGMALHHQFEGSDEGLQMWHDWSEPSDYYQPSECNRRWESFGNGPATVTFATLLHKAKKIRTEAADRAFEKALNRVALAKNKKVLTEECVKELAKSAQNDIQLDQAVRKVQVRLGELENGAKPRVESVRKLFQAAMPKDKKAKAETPRWCENWVYVQSENNFYHTVTGRKVSAAAFDRTFGRELISQENREKGESFAGKASDAALNLYCIPVVYDYLYFPGAEDFFELDGNKVVNTYNRHKIPLSQEPRNEDDRRALRIFEHHMEVLIKDPRERRLLLDYLAYNVQFPSERVHWAPVLQGVEGGGKSFFQGLMAVVMGESNIGLATAGDLHEQYTAWAEGSKLVFFEEVRIAGLEKYDVVNKIKGYITNPTVTIRRMQRNSYKIPNMTNYFMFTNYLDAIPFDKNDRRYFVVRTTFLTESHINLFLSQNPGYFDELFDILSTHGAVLRWYLETHELSSEFRPKGKAPRTESWELMYESSNGSEEDDELSELLAKGDNPLISETVLSAAALREASGYYGSLASRAFGFALNKAGFQLIAHTKLSANHQKDRFYTRRSEVFANQSLTATEVIRRLVGLSGDGFD